MKLSNIKQVLLQCIQHMGGVGDSVHGLASKYTSGFMPPDMFTGVNQLIRNPTFYDGEDVMKLKNGYYQGINWKNGPITHGNWIATVEVRPCGGDGRRFITFKELNGGRMWYASVESAYSGGKYQWFMNVESTDLYSNDNITTPNEVGSYIEVKPLHQGNPFRFSQVSIRDPESSHEFTTILEKRWGGTCTSVNMANDNPTFMRFYELSFIYDMDSNRLRIDSNNIVEVSFKEDGTTSTVTKQNKLSIFRYRVYQ